MSKRFRRLSDELITLISNAKYDLKNASCYCEKHGRRCFSCDLAAAVRKYMPDFQWEPKERVKGETKESV